MGRKNTTNLMNNNNAAATFTLSEQWSDVTPDNPTTMILPPSLPSYVTCGDDILYESGDGTDVVARVVSIDHVTKQMKVNIWLLENKAPSTLRIPPLNISVYDGVIGMTGVMYTNWTKNVRVDKVKDFAYIFHCDEIQSGLYSNAYGMNNSYFTRFTLFTKPTNREQHFMTLFAAKNHLPFYHQKNSFPQSSHFRIFKFLSQMKRNSDVVLWSERKFSVANGIGKGSPIAVHQDCWEYFCFRLKMSGVFTGEDIIKKDKSRVIRTFYKDLSSEAKTFHVVLTDVSAETTDQFKSLRDLFGTGYGFGVRRGRDTKKSGKRSLSILDRINAVDFYSDGSGISTDINDDYAPEFQNMIVFSYNDFTSMLSVRYYFRYMRVDSSRGQQLLAEIYHAFATVQDQDVIMEGSTFF